MRIGSYFNFDNLSTLKLYFTTPDYAALKEAETSENDVDWWEDIDD